MAALTRPTEATYVLHENVTIDTTDHEDHTFCGVIFPVECKTGLPVDHLVITSVAVRGMLGHLSVWVSNDTDEQEPKAEMSSGSVTYRSRSPRKPAAISVNPSNWTKIYESQHAPSMRDFQDLRLSSPLKLKPGEIRGIYIHSTRTGDESIVYDNQKGHYTHDDNFIRIRPGLAHLSCEPFGSVPPWGYGSAWRECREFVGRLSYGLVYKLWNPQEHFNFGSNFQTVTRTLFACQRRLDSPVARLPDDVIFFILNLCRWDWFEDSADEMMQKLNSDRTNGNESSSDSDQNMEEELDEEAISVRRRASAARRSWARRSHLSILAHLRRGVLLGTLGFGGSSDVEFIHDNNGESEDGDDVDDEDDDEWDFNRDG